MAAKFAEPSKAETVALLEKATPENHEKTNKYGVYNKTIIPLTLVVMSCCSAPR